MPLSDLPSVDGLLNHHLAETLQDQYGRTLTTQAIRHILDRIRDTFDPIHPVPDPEQILYETSTTLEAWTEPTLKPVINATGVIIHTNLGRSPLSASARRAVLETSLGCPPGSS